MNGPDPDRVDRRFPPWEPWKLLLVPTCQDCQDGQDGPVGPLPVTCRPGLSQSFYSLFPTSVHCVVCSMYNDLRRPYCILYIYLKSPIRGLSLVRVYTHVDTYRRTCTHTYTYISKAMSANLCIPSYMHIHYVGILTTDHRCTIETEHRQIRVKLRKPSS